MKALLNLSKYGLILVIFAFISYDLAAQCDAKRLESLFNSPGEMEYSRRGSEITDYSFEIPTATSFKASYQGKTILETSMSTFSIFYSDDVVQINIIQGTNNVTTTSYLYLAGQEIRTFAPDLREKDFQAKPVDDELIFRFYDETNQSYYFGLYNRKNKKFCYGEEKK